MVKICCIVCDKCRKCKNHNISFIFNKALGLSVVCSKCGNKYKKIVKEEESIKILTFFGLITNI